MRSTSSAARRTRALSGLASKAAALLPLLVSTLACGGALVSSPSEASTGSAIVTGSDPMLQPFPELARQQPAKAISRRAARNEFVSFQVLVQATDADVSGVRASLSGLTGPGGARIEGPSVTLYRVGYLDVKQTSFDHTKTGLYPDPLIPDVDESIGERRDAFPFTVPAGQTRSIWVDVHVPADTPPGTYSGAVQVGSDGFETSVPVTIEVLEASLPSTSTLASAFLLFGGNACIGLTGHYDCGSIAVRDRVLADFQRVALDHRITLPNVFLARQGPGYWDAWDATYAPFLNGTADTRLEGAGVTSIQYWGPRDSNQMAAWASHLRERGWLDLAYDYTGDEPPYGISFEEVKSRLATVKATVPDLRTLLTTNVRHAEDYGLSSDLDIITPVINHLDGVWDYAGDQRPLYDDFVSEPGNALWSYQSCMSQGCSAGSHMPENEPGSGWPSYMVDASAAKNRAMQWLLYLQDVSGELYYETALKFPTAWEDQFDFGGNGDGTLFYPGTPERIGGSTAVPLPSLRMKRIRMGMQDHEWLTLLSRQDADYAWSTARALIPAAHRVPDDGGLFESAREAIVARWLELNPPSAAPDVEPGEEPGDDPTPDTGPGDGEDEASDPEGGTPGTGADAEPAPGAGPGSGSATPDGTRPKVTAGCASAASGLPGMLPYVLVLVLLGGGLGRWRR